MNTINMGIAEGCMNAISKDNNVKDLFLGGSLRFGTDTPSSDVDIVVNLFKNSSSELTIDKLYRLGLNIFDSMFFDFVVINDNNYPSDVFVLKHAYLPIHVILPKTEDLYNDEKATHISICSVLEERPLLKSSITNLKAKYNIKGSDIYNLLKYLSYVIRR